MLEFGLCLKSGKCPTRLDMTLIVLTGMLSCKTSIQSVSSIRCTSFPYVVIQSTQLFSERTLCLKSIDYVHHINCYFQCIVPILGFSAAVCPLTIDKVDFVDSCTGKIDETCSYTCARGFTPTMRSVRCRREAVWDIGDDEFCTGEMTCIALSSSVCYLVGRENSDLKMIKYCAL